MTNTFFLKLSSPMIEEHPFVPFKEAIQTLHGFGNSAIFFDDGFFFIQGWPIWFLPCLSRRGLPGRDVQALNG